MRTNSAAKPQVSSKEELPDGPSLHFYDAEHIEASFANIAAQDAASNDDVEWSMPVLPDEARADRAFAFTRFDESPEELLTRGQEEKEPRAAGKKRVRESVLTNIRDIKKGSGQAFGVSLVVPTEGEGEGEGVGAEERKKGQGQLQWARDFAMDLNSSLADHYLLLVSDNDNVVSYTNVNVYIDLQRLTVDQIRPHDCEVNEV